MQPVLIAKITNFITDTTTIVYSWKEIIITASESNLRSQSQIVDTVFR